MNSNFCLFVLFLAGAMLLARLGTGETSSESLTSSATTFQSQEPTVLPRDGIHTIKGDLSQHLDKFGGEDFTVSFHGKIKYKATNGERINWRTSGKIVIDSQGKFSLTNMYPGSYMILVDGDRTWGEARLNFFSMTLAETKAAEFNIYSKYRLNGQFVDIISGQPVSGIAVEHPLNSYLLVSYPPIISDQQGRLEVPVYLRRYFQDLREEGFLGSPSLRIVEKPEGLVFPGNSQDRVVANAWHDLTFDVDVLYGVEVRGRVVESDGLTPVTGAEVDLTGPLRASTVSDEDGRFNFFISPNSQFTISAVHPLGRGSEQFLLNDDATDEIELCIKSTGAVSGTVRDKLGEPVEGVEVGVEKGSYGKFFNSNEYRTITDENGRYFIGNLPSDHEHFIGVRPKEATFFLKDTIQPVMLEPGEVRGNVDFHANIQAVRGRLVDASGRSVVGASLYSEYGLNALSTTDEDGVFSISGILASEPVLLKVKVEGLPENIIEWLPSEKDKEFVLDGTEPLFFIKIRKRGHFVATGLNLQIHPGEYVGVPTGNKDIWMFEGIPPGRQNIKISAVDVNGVRVATSKRHSIWVTDGTGQDPAVIDMAPLETPVTITTVHKATGEVVPNVKVTAHHFGDEAGKLSTAISDSEGKTQFQLNTYGSYALTATSDGLKGNASFTLEPSEDGHFEAKIEMSLYGTLRGQLFDHEGNPMKGAKVFHTQPSRETITDEEGRFELAEMPEGRTVLRFTDRKTESEFAYPLNFVEGGSDFQISWPQKVTYIGQLFINGEPALADNLYFGYAHSVAIPATPVDKGGYIVELYANTGYFVSYNVMRDERIFVEPTYQAVVRDFHFQIGSATLAIEGTIQPDSRLLSYRDGKLAFDASVFFRGSNRYEMDYLEPGLYQWEIVKGDRSYGISEPVEVVAGQHAEAVIKIAGN